MQTKGFISHIGQTEQVTDKFAKRDVVIEIEELNQNSGQYYSHLEAFQCINNNTSVLDNFRIGDEVVINFNIKSNKVEKDGVVRFFTNLTAYKIDKTGQEQYVSQPQQVAQYPPQQNYTSPQQNQSSVAGLNTPDSANGDDLPF